jgi:hypothetical protein
METSRMQGLLCVWLERPLDHVHQGRSAAGPSNPHTGSIGVLTILKETADSITPPKDFLWRGQLREVSKRNKEGARSITHTYTCTVISHPCYIPCQPLFSVVQSSYILCRAQVMKLLIMKFSQTSCYFVYLGFRCSLHHLLKHWQSFNAKTIFYSNTKLQEEL